MRQGVIRYSDSFKLKVVAEYESGKFRRYKEAHEAYGKRQGYTSLRVKEIG